MIALNHYFKRTPLWKKEKVTFNLFVLNKDYWEYRWQLWVSILGFILVLTFVVFLYLYPILTRPSVQDILNHYNHDNDLIELRE